MNTFATRSQSCFVDGTASRRITREERITLRNISIAKKSLPEKLAASFHRSISSLKAALIGPLKKSGPQNSMCKFYGHVIQGAWNGYLPKCADCGCEISSPDQLRKASPKH